ncbi:hypothetical protein FACS189431_5330 [Alphaproteobacteria bacterium]|nr:hypothetical protein FACS189431_5330 [Alphaproteobacteria bacterium]
MEKTNNNSDSELISPIEIAVKLIGNKWKLRIIWQLLAGRQRFGELQRNVPGNISQKVLTDNLRELERDGLLIRTVYAEVPPRVEYELSELGENARGILRRVALWGIDYYRKMNPGKKFHTFRDMVDEDDPRSTKSFLRKCNEDIEHEADELAAILASLSRDKL